MAFWVFDLLTWEFRACDEPVLWPEGWWNKHCFYCVNSIALSTKPLQWKDLPSLANCVVSLNSSFSSYLTETGTRWKSCLPPFLLLFLSLTIIESYYGPGTPLGSKDMWWTRQMRSYLLSLIFKWEKHTEIKFLNGKFDDQKTWLMVAWEHKNS